MDVTITCGDQEIKTTTEKMIKMNEVLKEINMPKIEARTPEQIEKDINDKNAEDGTGIIISKIKYDNKEMTIKYRKSLENYKDIKETTLVSTDYPHTDFINCLEALKDELLILLELPETYADNLQVYGITSGNGAVITAVKKFPDLGNKAFCINTPHLVYEAEDGEVELPKKTKEAIKTLIEEAKEFLKGKRKHQQLSLVK